MLASIVIPCFNGAEWIAGAIASARSQHLSDIEIIVVDDGSTDAAMDVARAGADADRRVRIVERERAPRGACACRNEGALLATGKFLLFLDADDLIEPFCLEQRVAAMEAHPALDFAIFPSLMFEKTPHDLGLWWNIEKPEDELSRQFRQDAICQTSGVLWRSSAFHHIGMWDETLAIWQDIDLFFRAFIQGYRYAKFFELPPDLHVRRTPNSLSRGGFFAPAKVASRAQVVRRAVGLLKANGMGERVPEARAMVAEIACGAARANQFDAAHELLEWAVEEGVLAARERRTLKATVFARQTRLVKLPPVRSWIGRAEGRFHEATTVGMVPHEPSAEESNRSSSRHEMRPPSLTQAE